LNVKCNIQGNINRSKLGKKKRGNRAEKTPVLRIMRSRLFPNVPQKRGLHCRRGAHKRKGGREGEREVWRSRDAKMSFRHTRDKKARGESLRQRGNESLQRSFAFIDRTKKIKQHRTRLHQVHQEKRRKGAQLRDRCKVERPKLAKTGKRKAQVAQHTKE